MAGATAANQRRRQQAEAIARIVSARMRPNSSFVVTGDLNDPPGSEFLAPMLDKLTLVNGLIDAVEDRSAPADDPPAPKAPWTYRFKKSGEPAHYQLFDHVWLSASAAARQVGAGINRRTLLGGNGSDHDPAWVELNV